MYRCIDRFRCFYLYFQLKKQPFLKAPFSGVGQKDWALDRGDFPSV